MGDTGAGSGSITIDEGKIYFTNAGLTGGSSGGISGNTINLDAHDVCVAAKIKSVEHTIMKEFKQYAMPVSPANKNTQTTTTYIIDLKRITGMLKFECYIVDDPEILRYKIGQTSTGYSAIMKKNMLRHLNGDEDMHNVLTSWPQNTYWGGVFFVTWGLFDSNMSKNRSQLYTGTFDKIMMKENPKNVSGTFENAGSSGESITGRLSKIDITASFKIGVDRV